MANVFAMCGACHSPAAQGLIRVKTFFTLFFIPLIPVGTKYRSVCTMCGATSSLTKDQADQAMAMAQRQRAQATSGAGAPSVPAAGGPFQDAIGDTMPPQLEGSAEAGNPPVD